MYGCKNWTVKKSEHWIIDAFELWCLRRLLRVPYTARDKPVHPKGNQSWIVIGRTDAEAETPILWTPDAKNWLIGKDPNAGKDWRQEEKAEDEMVEWHHRLCGHEFEQAPGVGDGQESLACCSPWSHIESDMTEQLNWGYGRNLDVHWQMNGWRNNGIYTHNGILLSYKKEHIWVNSS